MTRKSITLTTPNDESLKNQANTEEFYSKFVRAKLDKGEKSGFAKKQTREEMLAEFKKGLSDV
ncbi:CopG family transcriptional regulator [Flavobacterium luteolum]|uniref:CopG family transcriptional regulator n=1 Tax=Flavobacterium luteolum TaxID=3003259 RepID=UPI00248E2A12|nr:CopG family transcriptional regulator [Flavobacterium luteolum]